MEEIPVKYFDWTNQEIRDRISGKRSDAIPVEARMYIYAEAKRLNSTGLSSYRIANKLGTPQSTVSGWINGKHSPLSKLNIVPLYPTKDLAKLFGVLTISGTVKPQSGEQKTRWEVSITRANKKEMKIARSCLERVFGKKFRHQCVKTTYGDEGYSIGISSRHLVEFWNGYWNVPSYLEREEYWETIDEYPRHFLAGVFDLSGGYGVKRESKFIRLQRRENYRKSKKCLNIVSNKLDECGINHKIQNNKLEISKVTETDKFLDLIPLENDKWRENLPKTKRKGDWSEEEDTFIKKNWKDMTDEEIGEELGRTSDAVKNRRVVKLGLRRQPPWWSKEEEEFLKENYKKMGIDDLIDILGRSREAIITKASKITSTNRSGGEE